MTMLALKVEDVLHLAALAANASGECLVAQDIPAMQRNLRIAAYLNGVAAMEGKVQRKPSLSDVAAEQGPWG